MLTSRKLFYLRKLLKLYSSNKSVKSIIILIRIYILFSKTKESIIINKTYEKYENFHSQLTHCLLLVTRIKLKYLPSNSNLI